MPVLLTTSQAAEELGCAVTTFRRLVHAGLLPGLSRRGVRVMVPLETVRDLRDRAPAPIERLPVSEIAVLRADAAPLHVPPGQAVTGFSTVLPADRLLTALNGNWRCNPKSVAAGGVLPVTLSGFVVAVLTGLDTWEKDDRGHHRFPDAVLAGHVTDLVQPVTHLTAPRAGDRKLAGLLLGARLASHSGGAVAYVRTRITD